MGSQQDNGHLRQPPSASQVQRCPVFIATPPASEVDLYAGHVSEGPEKEIGTAIQQPWAGALCKDVEQGEAIVQVVLVQVFHFDQHHPHHMVMTGMSCAVQRRPAILPEMCVHCGTTSEQAADDPYIGLATCGPQGRSHVHGLLETDVVDVGPTV
mmetsp:Transcript_49687/g.93189  ORF Transcript_49687/g.93189 Transcript_49687/m.93189 type:complete len:155 (+) Transcript_49687:1145-1609(+)